MTKVIRAELHSGSKLEYLDDSTLRVTNRFNKVTIYKDYMDYADSTRVDKEYTLSKALEAIDKQFGKK